MCAPCTLICKPGGLNLSWLGLGRESIFLNKSWFILTNLKKILTISTTLTKIRTWASLDLKSLNFKNLDQEYPKVCLDLNLDCSRLSRPQAYLYVSIYQDKIDHCLSFSDAAGPFLSIPRVRSSSCPFTMSRPSSSNLLDSVSILSTDVGAKQGHRWIPAQLHPDFNAKQVWLANPTLSTKPGSFKLILSWSYNNI